MSRAQNFPHESPEGASNIREGLSVEGTHIWFYCDVDSETIADLNTNLVLLGKRNLKAAIDYDWDPPPIHLHVHSYGGELYPAFAGLETIRRCPVPVHTHIEGGVASAATLLTIGGSYRSIGATSSILLHQISTEFWGKFEDLKDEAENMDILMKRFSETYLRYSKITQEQIDKILKKELWFTAEQALEFGLVDEIFDD